MVVLTRVLEYRSVEGYGCGFGHLLAPAIESQLGFSPDLLGFDNLRQVEGQAVYANHSVVIDVVIVDLR